MPFLATRADRSAAILPAVAAAAAKLLTATAATVKTGSREKQHSQHLS
jgi:hypothetical protein